MSRPEAPREGACHRAIARAALVLGATGLLVLAPCARAAGGAPNPPAHEVSLATPLALEHEQQALAQPALVEAGRLLYTRGRRADGSLLEADRLDAGVLRGERAACIACHKSSGMGGTEGDIIVPPINGPALYAGTKLRERVIISMDPRRGRFFNPSHEPYDARTLEAAIAGGTHVSGRPMNVLMPRYRLQPGDFDALQAYLGQLSVHVSPGVSGNGVRFATVITPGVDAARKDIFLRSLRALFDQKNSNTLPGHRHMIAAAEGMLNFERNWELDVWELQGPPEGWDAQLRSFYERAPVFAIASGLARGEWTPVQQFCERERIPCWFPSIIDPPEGADRQFYSFYFSGGVSLEASVLAQHLASPDMRAPTRVVQVLRDEPAARAAADHFAHASQGHWPVETRALAPEAPLGPALADLRAGDALVLWLGAGDLAALASVPAPAVPAYASTYLGGPEGAALPPAWRKVARLVYPYELPEKRLHNESTFRSWLAIRNLPLVDEGLQSEVFFSIGYLQFTMTEMLDNLYRDCLVDRGESMVRRRELLRAEEESLVRQGGHPPAPEVAARSRLAPGAVFGDDPNGPMAQKNTPHLGQREGTTIYPRLALAPGQRLASKGAYIVRFEQSPGGEALVADSPWIVP